MSSIEAKRDTGETTRPRWYAKRLIAPVAATAYLLLFADGVIPQLQMLPLSGQLLINNVVAKVALLICLVAGIALHPRLQTAGLPILTWMLCLGYLFADFWHLLANSGLTPVDIAQTYNAYYSVLLAAPATLAIRGKVPERLLTRCIVWFLIICAIIGTAQNLSGQPLLYTESADGSFYIPSWEFFDQVRAFSLFSCGLQFGFFCAFCGALGVALYKRFPARGTLLVILSAFACYTTLTRACYLVFFCACLFSALVTFGQKPTRGLFSPLLYFALALGTALGGIRTSDTDPANDLQSAGSLIARVIEWTYYGDMLANAPLLDRLFGLGIVQHDSFADSAPLPIDNLFLALALHIGVVGMVLFLVLMTRMWLYLRRKAIASQQPFIIAATSLCATFPCSGTFNIVFVSFGASFGAAIICGQETGQPNATPGPLAPRFLKWVKALLMPASPPLSHQG